MSRVGNTARPIRGECWRAHQAATKTFKRGDTAFIVATLHQQGRALGTYVNRCRIVEYAAENLINLGLARCAGRLCKGRRSQSGHAGHKCCDVQRNGCLCVHHSQIPKNSLIDQLLRYVANGASRPVLENSGLLQKQNYYKSETGGYVGRPVTDQVCDRQQKSPKFWGCCLRSGIPVRGSHWFGSRDGFRESSYVNS